MVPRICARSNGCLVALLQAKTPGYRMMLEAGAQQQEVRTGEAG
jgi:hypothetical protein